MCVSVSVCVCACQAQVTTEVRGTGSSRANITGSQFVSCLLCVLGTELKSLEEHWVFLANELSFQLSFYKCGLMELDISSLKILSNLIKHKKENWYTITALKYCKKNVLGGGGKNQL